MIFHENIQTTSLRDPSSVIWHSDLSYVVDFVKPSGDSFERPFVCDVVDQENALRPPRVGTDDCAEPALAARVPQLKFDTLPINQNYRGFVSCNRSRRGPF